ncbi:hypothetical protein MVEG_08186 [Podila verticillata NRRL 6337]|nr:hypothetical protein MVEG_08186 [Podila verticillata NRRL 6337]
MTDTESKPYESPEINPSVREPRKHVPTAKPKPPLTEEEWANKKKPMVLIVGAGIGGLMLGNLLQKGNVPYLIFERAKEVKPLGSAMSLGATITPLLKQLGIYEDFVALGRLNKGWTTYNEHLEKMFYTDVSERVAIAHSFGQESPTERIHLGKKVLSLLQNENGVMIRCHDNSTHHGDILVGCDGAYSAVRQHLYKDLKVLKQLPKSDDVPLPFSCVTLVGQTEVLDPEEFPDLKIATFTTAKNKVCWSVVQYLNKKTSRDNDAFRNSEWGPEAAEEMCRLVRHFKVPGGKDGRILTMGDLIDRTPKELISKVMLEEKLFDTWNYGRTLSPAGGAGALTAMHDAVALANWICTLQTKAQPEIEAIFKEYRNERYPIAKKAFESSKLMRLTGGKVCATRNTKIKNALPTGLG